MTEAQRAVLVDEVTHALEQRGVEREGAELKFRCFHPERHKHNDMHWSAYFNPAKAVWLCRVCSVRGGLLDLADRLGVPRPQREIPAAAATEDFARSRCLTLETLRRFGVRPVIEYGRQALRYPTSVGIDRLKFLDGKKPKYRWASTGGRRHWYGRPGALARLRAGASTLYIVNGEPGVWACAQAGVAAISPCGGEGATPTATMVAELAGALREFGRPIAVHVVYDTDAAGRTGALEHVRPPLAAAGLDVEVLDIGATIPDMVGADVDDLHRRVGDAGLAAALADLLRLGVSDLPGEEASPDSRQPWLRLVDVEPEAVAWLWPGRIPLGKVTLLEGDPDEGKSCVAIDIAARVTRGLAMPNTCDAASEPAGVVFVTAEDGLADTIRPRLDAAGGDPERVLVFALDALPQIDEAGLQTIEHAIRACGARLLVLDPLNAFLSERVDTYKDHHIRRALAPLAALAARTGAAVFVIRHLNKSGGQNAKYRGGGSIGIFGAARSALLAAPDPDELSHKVLAVNKHNLSSDVPALGYELVQVDLPASGAKPISTVQVRWLGPTTHTARDLLVDAEGDDDRSALDEAIAWLRDQLTSGPQLAEEMFKATAKVRIAERTLQRARARIATSRKDDFKAGWVWELKPDQAAKVPSLFCHPGAFAWFGAFADSSGCGGGMPEGATSTSSENLGAFGGSGNLEGAKVPTSPEGAKNAEGAKMPKGTNASTVDLPDRPTAGVRDPGEDDVEPEVPF
jgi:hypothetical protein